MEVSGQLHKMAALHSGNVSQYQLDKRMGGPRNRSGVCEEEKIHTFFLRIQQRKIMFGWGIYYKMVRREMNRMQSRNASAICRLRKSIRLRSKK
jgi:hypothetical protein